MKGQRCKTGRFGGCESSGPAYYPPPFTDSKGFTWYKHQAIYICDKCGWPTERVRWPEGWTKQAKKR